MAGPDSATKDSTVLKFLPVGLILVPLGVHFLLVGFVLVFSWLPTTYFYSHLVLLAVGLWATYDQKNILPVIVFIAVVVMTLILDCIQLGLYFPAQQSNRGDGGSTSDRTWQFSAAMTFINLLLKPVTGILAGVSIFLRSEHGRSLHVFGGTRGHSSEEAPQIRSGYATSGSYVPPSAEYTTPYEKPVAAPVRPVVVGPTEPVPHYESQY